MKTVVIWFALCTFAFAVEPVRVDLHYSQLKLKNNEVISDATIQTYDYLHGSISIFANRTLRQLPTYLLPQEVLEQLEALAPPLTEKERQKALKDEDMAAKKQANQEERKTKQEEAREAAHARTQQRIAAAAGRKQGTELENVAKAAEAFGKHYFKYDYGPNSSIGMVGDIDLEMEDPEQMMGWGSRYRVRGLAGLDYISNTGESLKRVSVHFEVILEMPQGAKPKLISVDLKQVGTSG